MCPECLKYRAIIHQLHGRVEQLKLIIKDMGAPVDFDEDLDTAFGEGMPLVSEKDGEA